MLKKRSPSIEAMSLLLSAAVILSACKDDGSPTDDSSAPAPASSLSSAPPVTISSSTSPITSEDGAVVTGTQSDDTLDGGSGHDTLIGGEGSDSITGGDGDDLLIAGGDSLVPATGSTVGDGPFLVVDQFGYRPEMAKVAIIRDPRFGFDASDALTPEPMFKLIDLSTGQAVHEAAPVIWRDGDIDQVSGDAIWHYDFSTVTTPGDYVVRDQAGVLVSSPFTISDTVYEPVMRTALRAFFYQRAGFAKEYPFADEGYADGASHMGPGQDTEARLFSSPDDPSTARDLHGGWYDAGDYNKYTNWTAAYVSGLLTTYLERPDIWGDDLNIPESGNGTPDILDEVKWSVDWLMRMQNADGSVLSIVGLDEASPPSAATGPSYYGPASTSATLSTAAAFAIASIVYAESSDPDLQAYAADCLERAEQAWAWAQANPSVVFRNNDATFNSIGLGAGQQEVDDAGRATLALNAAIHLAAATQKQVYHEYATANYMSSGLVSQYYIDSFREAEQRDLLYYTQVPGANTQVVDTIRSRYTHAMNHENQWGAIDSIEDPYRAHLPIYTWGSSRFKSTQAALYLQSDMYDLDSRRTDDRRTAAAGFLHYIHGINPFGLVYLSNMSADGAEHSVDTFYHLWFDDGSTLWDSVSNSTYGPAPGFVVGGANPQYTWDVCCPVECGSPANRVSCGVAPLSPPSDQPPAKSYLEFNDGWPQNSWQITENSNGYQVSYIRLLAHFID